MNRRHFLLGAGATSAAPFVLAATELAPASPAILTISGAIDRHNRGALDPALDQMMHKQHVAFDAAYTFDYASLLAMPARAIRPTLEYDGRAHTLSGPPLLDVLAAVSARLTADATVLLRAVDGYAVAPTVSDLHRYDFILATQLDGKPMPLGGLGPLWAVYDADRIAELAAKPLNQRFALCPWATYHVEVR